MARYVADVERRALPTIDVDQLRIHVAGNVPVVSVRSFTRPDRFNRFNTYERRDGAWGLCARVRLGFRPLGPSSETELPRTSQR
jgi:hypothetical protein